MNHKMLLCAPQLQRLSLLAGVCSLSLLDLHCTATISMPTISVPVLSRALPETRDTLGAVTNATPSQSSREASSRSEAARRNLRRRQTDAFCAPADPYCPFTTYNGYQLVPILFSLAQRDGPDERARTFF